MNDDYLREIAENTDSLGDREYLKYYGLIWLTILTLLGIAWVCVKIF